MRKILWLYAKLVTLILIPVVLLIAYSISGIDISTTKFDVEKVTWPSTSNFSFPRLRFFAAGVDTVAAEPVVIDTVPQPEPEEEVFTVDTTRRRVLLIGDSMVDGLRYRMADYAMENGYDLMAVVWFSSNTRWYSRSDTLRHYIKKHNPDFIMISLGGNEQYMRDLDKRAGYVQTIMDKIGDIPFVWIGTPSWRKNNSDFNDCVRSVVGERRYYESSHLQLQRTDDHMHPTISASAKWMDSVAVWMSSPLTAYPIRMNPPTEKRKRVYKTIKLQPKYP